MHCLKKGKSSHKPAPAQKAFSNVITRYYNGIKEALTSPVETVAKVGASLINGLNNFVKKDKMDLGNFVARQAEDAYNAAVDRVTSSDDPMYEMHTMLEELVIEVSASAAIGSGVSALVGRAGMGAVASSTVASSEVPMPIGPLLRGSTGRTIPKNLIEQMSMNAVRKNPNLGIVIMENMKDSRWSGWSKMEFKTKSSNGVNAVIHYQGKFVNGQLKYVDDFKFK